MEGFFRKKGVAGVFLGKGRIILWRRERQGFYRTDYLTSIDQDWFKIPLLEENEAAIRLLSFGLVMWLSKSDSILAVFLNFF